MIDYSLHKLMKINRYRFRNRSIPNIDIVIFDDGDDGDEPDIENPLIVTSEFPSIELPTNTTSNTTFVLSDFGENAINSHSSNSGGHSSKVQTIFNYVTKDFRDRCTSIESYSSAECNYSMVANQNILNVASVIDADIVMTPYVGAASWREYEYYDFVLPVSSHYDNSGSDGDSTNSNRRDITAASNILLTNSVAVSARRDTPATLEESTSYGYGMEFFEDISPEGLDADYPIKDIPSAFAELLSEDGLTFTSNVHLTFTQYIEVGETITIRRNDSAWETGVVATINSANSFTIENAITPITTANTYGWHDVTLGSYCGGQAQSWAVPIVAGKLKVIKMTTNADWDTVRYAARVTAKRNPTGIAEIDNAYWDIYRGFGQIQVQAAIDYINNN